MTRQLTETIFGAIILVLAIGFGSYAFQRAGLPVGGGGKEYYVLHAEFSSAEGIRKGSDIRMMGIEVGEVTDLRLDTQRLVARASFKIDKMIALPDDSTAAITSEGLLGGHFVEIIPGGSFATLEDGDQITYTQAAVSFLTLLSRFATSSASAPPKSE